MLFLKEIVFLEKLKYFCLPTQILTTRIAYKKGLNLSIATI